MKVEFQLILLEYIICFAVFEICNQHHKSIQTKVSIGFLILIKPLFIECSKLTTNCMACNLEEGLAKRGFEVMRLNTYTTV